MTSRLLTPYKLGNHELANRVVMAPMTRNRAHADGVPSDISVTYYAQRASAGLIVTEGTQPSALGQAYPHTPGLHTDDQQAGWARIADAVHAANGVIFVQLMHGGRISHPRILPGGETPAGPSAVRPAGQIYTGDELEDFVTPRAYDVEELPGLVGDYVQAAQRAVAAGLDGVELHAANGYQLHQFLAENSNVRTDEYGGTPQRRARFVLEVARAVSEAIGPDRVGIRISPGNKFNDIAETTTEETYRVLVDGLHALELGYLHVIGRPTWDLVHDLRERFGGTFVLNVAAPGAGTDVGTAETVLEEGLADLVSFGRSYIANPDLVERIRLGAPLAAPDESTFYTRGPAGYIDYQALEVS